jgi:hypothetical protein
MLSELQDAGTRIVRGRGIRFVAGMWTVPFAHSAPVRGTRTGNRRLVRYHSNLTMDEYQPWQSVSAIWQGLRQQPERPHSSTETAGPRSPNILVPAVSNRISQSTTSSRWRSVPGRNPRQLLQLPATWFTSDFSPIMFQVLVKSPAQTQAGYPTVTAAIS